MMNKRHSYKIKSIEPPRLNDETSTEREKFDLATVFKSRKLENIDVKKLTRQ